MLLMKIPAFEPGFLLGKNMIAWVNKEFVPTCSGRKVPAL